MVSFLLQLALFHCTIASMAFIQRQLHKDRKMRKGLRDFKLAEHSVLALALV